MRRHSLHSEVGAALRRLSTNRIRLKSLIVHLFACHTFVILIQQSSKESPHFPRKKQWKSSPPFQHLAEGSRIHSQLQSSLILLGKTKEKYEKAFGASERALDAYKKADEDLNLSRAEVEKQRMNSTIKTQQCEDAKNEYANQLQKTNEWQVCH